jgi:hypothetical protein
VCEIAGYLLSKYAMGSRSPASENEGWDMGSNLGPVYEKVPGNHLNGYQPLSGNSSLFFHSRYDTISLFLPL